MLEKISDSNGVLYAVIENVIDIPDLRIHNAEIVVGFPVVLKLIDLLNEILMINYYVIRRIG